ncbi:hypothetical protein LAZ67_23001415 [Cordylochernes scorpioides]|uniref:G-protein coupled receptors family 1 profile domain-containing protein n=1 Tax=Cordylochernes scorpioides TaxID=51811 RepID=A0ABY6LUX6_9ARAC|nr:hypothetical protein LAZ67_23001415 [Cordylochernes scorpioides]
MSFVHVVIDPRVWIQVFLDRPEEVLTPWRMNKSFVPIVVTHAVTFLVGVAGNSVVIATWAGLRPSPTCAFLVSLAAADLLLLLVYVPLETLQYFVVTWDAGGAICKLSSYVEMLSGMASVLNLTAVSFERFLVIAFPMRARRLCTLNRCRQGLVLIWLLALVLSAPVLATKVGPTYILL